MNIYSASISSKELKRLSALQPWRTILALALDWLVIAAAIAASEYSGSIWVYLLALVFIGGRMHALGVLVHEAAHFRVLRNRQASEWIMDIFAAWPILATVDGYRQNHLAHHQHANTEKDPDWIVKFGTAAFTFPQKVRHAVLQLLGYLVAINSFRDLAQILPRISKNDRSTRLYKLNDGAGRGERDLDRDNDGIACESTRAVGPGRTFRTSRCETHAFSREIRTSRTSRCETYGSRESADVRAAVDVVGATGDV